MVRVLLMFSLINMITRFHHINLNMERARRIHGKGTERYMAGNMVICSLLLLVHFSCRHSDSAECTRTLYRSANAWRDAEETEEPCRGTAWLLSAYAVSGQQAEAISVQRAAKPAPWRTHGERLACRSVPSTGAVHWWPDMSPHRRTQILIFCASS